MEWEHDCVPMNRLAIATLALLLTPAAALAQGGTPYEERGFFQVGGGAQSGSHLATSTATFSIYDEQGSIVGSQSYGGGGLFTVGGGARVWKNLVLTVNYARVLDNAESAVVARVPHPLFVNRFREVTQAVEGLEHIENQTHITASWQFVVRRDLVIGVGVGPSFVAVSHEFASAPTVQEVDGAPNFNTVSLGAMSIARAKKTATTANIGADVTYDLPFNLGQAGDLGATLGFRYAGGTASMAAPSGATDIKYGGAQIYGAIRVTF